MSKLTPPEKENLNNSRRREAFDRDSEHVMAILDSRDAKARTSPKFGEALIALSGSLFGMAYFFLRGEPNLARRRDLAEEAKQIWLTKMLSAGFKSYMTEGKPFGLPYGPFARTIMRNVCIDLLRGRDRACTLASLDGFSDPRRSQRDTPERRALELDCRELMQKLPPKWQEMLRLLYWHGFSILEISELFQTNPRTVATWHMRSRKLLGNEFRKRGYWPP